MNNFLLEKRPGRSISILAQFYLLFMYLNFSRVDNFFVSIVILSILIFIITIFRQGITIPHFLIAFLTIFCFIVVTSSLGHEYITQSFKNAFATVVFTISTSLCVSACSQKGNWKYLTQTLMMVVFANIAFFFLSENALHPISDYLNYGNFRGLSSHKNEAGAVFVFLLMFCVHGYVRTSKWFFVICILLCLYCLYETGSKTALYLLPVLSIFYALLLRNQRRLLFLTAISVTALFILNACIILLNDLIPTQAFTGRGALWRFTYYYLEKDFFVGHGFRIFHGMMLYNSSDVYNAYSLVAPHSHNALLDLGISVGFVQAVILYFIVTIVPFYALLQLENQKHLPLLFSLHLFFSLRTLTESSLLQFDNLSWLSWVFVLTLIFMETRQNERTKSKV